MKYATILLILLLLQSPAEAQLFRNLFRSSSSGYSQTSSGYNYRGKHYTLGVDNPVCSSPNCPMCVALRAAKQQRQDQPLPYTKEVTTQSIGTPFNKVKEMYDILSPLPGKVVLDPGCGDGRLLVEGVRRGCRGIGIEINPTTYSTTKEVLSGQPINFYLGDSRKFSFREADYIVLYLFSDLINELYPKFSEIKPGGKVISYLHPIPNSQKIGDFYLWTK